MFDVIDDDDDDEDDGKEEEDLLVVAAAVVEVVVAEAIGMSNGLVLILEHLLVFMFVNVAN